VLYSFFIEFCHCRAASVDWRTAQGNRAIRIGVVRFRSPAEL
jgi:hypothetical protein